MKKSFCLKNFRTEVTEKKGEATLYSPCILSLLSHNFSVTSVRNLRPSNCEIIIENYLCADEVITFTRCKKLPKQPAITISSNK